MSMPEWGVYPGSAHAGNNGGDNSFYINKMVEFFTSMGPNLAYEGYFNEDAEYYAGAIFEPNQNPNAAGTYQNLIKAAVGKAPVEGGAATPGATTTQPGAGETGTPSVTETAPPTTATPTTSM